MGKISKETLQYFWDKINAKKQDVLQSGKNIKTINGESLLGGGDISISGGGGFYGIDTSNVLYRGTGKSVGDENYYGYKATEPCIVIAFSNTNSSFSLRIDGVSTWSFLGKYFQPEDFIIIPLVSEQMITNGTAQNSGVKFIALGVKTA